MAAAQWLGAVPVPVYADSVADEMAYVLAHAEVTHAVAQDQEQVDKLLSVAEQVPLLKHILYDEERGLRDYDHARLSPVAEVIEEGRRRLADDPAEPERWSASWRRDAARTSPSSSTPPAPRGGRRG
jgi:long-chain acyl-CoA synthetase